MGVKQRILVSVSAWLAGAAVATSGTLVAISWIGQGISTGSVHTLSVDEVTSELADMSPSPGGTTGDSADSPSPSPMPTSMSPSQSASRLASAPSTTSPPRTLTSAGGSVIAVCSSAGAYLTSWSPAENFQVDDVRRGPARVARVDFQSGLTDVYLGVFCDNGVPTAFSPGVESPGQTPDH